LRNDFQSWPFSLTKVTVMLPEELFVWRQRWWPACVIMLATITTQTENPSRYNLIYVPKIWSCKTWVVLPIKFRSMRWPDQATPITLGITKETLSMSGALTQRKSSGVTLSQTYFWWLLVYLQKSLLGSDLLVPQSKPRGIMLPWKFMWRFVNYRLTICRFLNICLYFAGHETWVHCAHWREFKKKTRWL
jgi:hypothetical protein